MRYYTRMDKEPNEKKIAALVRSLLVELGEDPSRDGSFRGWRAGDTYLTYPGDAPSFRFLEMRNGIATAEKLRILKSQGLFADEIAALAKRYDYQEAMANKTDFAKLKEATLKLVNR